MKMKKYLKKKNQLRYYKFSDWLKIYSYFKTCQEKVRKNQKNRTKTKKKMVSQGFKLKNINKTRNCFVEEIEHNELMSNKHRKVCATLNYIASFLFLASAVTGCISSSVFASLLGIPIGIISSRRWLKIWVITAEIKMHKLIFQKNKIMESMIKWCIVSKI